jgi:hypothetical protein
MMSEHELSRPDKEAYAFSKACTYLRSVLLYAVDNRAYEVFGEKRKSSVDPFQLDLDTFVEHFYVRSTGLEADLTGRLLQAPFHPVLVFGRLGVGKTSFVTATLFHDLRQVLQGLAVRIELDNSIIPVENWAQLSEPDRLAQFMTSFIETISAQLDRLVVSKKLHWREMLFRLLLTSDIRERRGSISNELSRAIAKCEDEFDWSKGEGNADYQFETWMESEYKQSTAWIRLLLSELREQASISTKLQALIAAHPTHQTGRVVIFLDNIENLDNSNYIDSIFRFVRKAPDYLGNCGQLVVAMRPATAAAHLSESELRENFGTEVNGKLPYNSFAIRFGVLQIATGHDKKTSKAKSAISIGGTEEAPESTATDSLPEASDPFELEMLRKRSDYLVQRLDQIVEKGAFKEDLDTICNIARGLLSNEYAERTLPRLFNLNRRDLLTAIVNFVEYLHDRNGPLYLAIKAGKEQTYGDLPEHRFAVLSALYEFLGTHISEYPSGAKYSFEMYDPVSWVTQFKRKRNVKSILLERMVLLFLNSKTKPHSFDEDQPRVLFEALFKHLEKFKYDRESIVEQLAMISAGKGRAWMIESSRQFTGDMSAIAGSDEFSILPRGCAFVQSLGSKYSYLVALMKRHQYKIDGQVLGVAPSGFLSEKAILFTIYMLRELGESEVGFVIVAGEERKERFQSLTREYLKYGVNDMERKYGMAWHLSHSCLTFLRSVEREDKNRMPKSRLWEDFFKASLAEISTDFNLLLDKKDPRIEREATGAVKSKIMKRLLECGK